MKLFGWIKERKSESDRERRRWRQAWGEAMAAEDASRLATLRSALDGLPLQKGDDIEVELEMLDALERQDEPAISRAVRADIDAAYHVLDGLL